MLLAALLLMVGAQTMRAQGITINFTNNNRLSYDISKIESIEFDQYAIFEKPVLVDLGLPSGTLWAAVNIGAKNAEECGYFYAWGETKPKDEYSWATYQHCNGTYLTMNKYCTDEYFGLVDGLKVLEDDDDVATTLFGKNWSLPTKEQFEELMNQDYTTWKRVSRNDVWGILVTSKKTNWSIFLPLGGYRDGTTSYNTDRGYYWMKNLYVSVDYLGRSFSIESNGYNIGDSKYRRCGLNIRPVYKEPVREFVEIGGVKWATMNVGATTVAGSYKTCCGDYFIWGETEPRYSAISWTNETTATFTWKNEYQSGYTKENMVAYAGSTLNDEHDAATANWGSEWRTPTKEDFAALRNACTSSGSSSQTPTRLTSQITKGGIYWLDSTQTIENAYTGVCGILFVSADDISKRIFFPACGIIDEKDLFGCGEEGVYISSSVYNEANYIIYQSKFSSAKIDVPDAGIMYFGDSVRPVKK